MGKKNMVKRAIGLISALVVLAGFIYGCYSKEAVRAEQTIYGQDNRPSPLSDEELRKFADSVRKVDGEAEAHYQLALYFQEKYRHKLAIDELKQVLMRSPGHAKAYNALGVSFDNLGDHDAAIDYYKLAINIDFKLDYAHNNLGYSYLLKGDFQKAAEAFQQAIALNGKEKRYRNNLGLVYVKQDKMELALEEFRALDSGANAEKMLARVMKDLGKGAATIKALPDVKPASGKEQTAEPDSPASKLPDLSANAVTPTAGHDSTARFQSVKGENNTLPDVEAYSGFQGSGVSHESDSAEKKSKVGADELFAKEKKEPVKGPVINIPPPLTQTTPYEIEMASVPMAGLLKEPVAEVGAEVKYYHLSSVAFSRDVKEAKKPSAPGEKVDCQANIVTRELREILPANIKIANTINQEEKEKRILVAASAIKAGGWQNAPEPRQTAEKRRVEIEVANGNGEKGSAGKVADHLRRSGFKVVRVLDAQSYDHCNSKVFYYGDNLEDAKRVLKAIPEISSDAEFYKLEPMGNHIRLLIGKDLIERNKNLSWALLKVKTHVF